MPILIIILVNLIFYLRTIWYSYTSDDCMPSGKKEPIPKNPLHYLWIHLLGIRYINSKFAHSLNLVIHTLNCVLIYFVFGSSNISFLAALLFAVNPVNTQGGSVWISGKGYAMSTTATLLMFLLPYLAPVFYFFSIQFFAFSTIISALLFIPTEWWFLSLLFILAFIILRKKIWVQQVGAKAESATPVMKEIRPYKFIIFCKSFGYYTQLALWPIRLGHYHEFLYAFGVSAKDNEECLKIDWNFWKGLIITLTTATLLILNWGNPIGFGLFWWCVGIGMWCNITTIQMCIAERYVYLPVIGLMYVLANVISKLPTPVNYILLASYFTFLCTKLWLHTTAYKDERHLAYRNHFDFPDFYYPYSWIGMFYKDKGRRYEALGWWADALDHRPLDFKVLFNLSHLLGELGYLNDAYLLLEKAKQSLIPDTYDQKLIPMIENRQKHLKEAIEKSEIATHNQIIEMANKLKKGEKC